MNIGNAARHTGLPVKTIRYYEQIGLVRADRQINGYRDYSPEHLQRLTFLKRARGFGFALDDCRTLLDLYQDPSRASSDVKAVAGRHLQKLKLKAAELEQLMQTLQHLVSTCAGSRAPDCPIITELALTDTVPRQLQTGSTEADKRYPNDQGDA